MDEQEKTTEQSVSAERMALALAIRQSMHEIMTENKGEIIKRTEAKLVAMGIKIEDDEIGNSL